MKIRRSVSVMLLAACMTAACTGCGSVKYEPEASGVFLCKDGTVKSAEIEAFSNEGLAEERYKEDELLQFVEETVIAYNQDTCGSPEAYAKKDLQLNVAVESLSVKDGVATLILNYADCDNYLDFNEANEMIQELQIQPASTASAAGVIPSGMLDSEGGAADVSSMMGEKYYAVVAQGSADIAVEGEITAVSEGVTIKNKNTAVITGENPAVILFK